MFSFFVRMLLKGLNLHILKEHSDFPSNGTYWPKVVKRHHTHQIFFILYDLIDAICFVSFVSSNMLLCVMMLLM